MEHSLRQFGSQQYVLEFEWAYDHTNTDYIVFTIEAGSQFTTSAEERDERDKLDAQAETYALGFFNKCAPGHGSKKMLRLHRVLDRIRIGITKKEMAREESGLVLKMICIKEY